MQEITYPNNLNFWIVKDDSGNTVHEGMTEPNQVTTTGQSEIIGSDDASDVFPELPNKGLLKENEIYSYQGGMVIIVQDHERTIYPPQLTPALITFYRKEVGELEWIENEQVEKGWIRTYEGIQYEVVLGHLTQINWIPPNTPTLWEEHKDTPDYPVWKQPTGAHDAYNIGDRVHFPELESSVYESKINGNTYSPTVYPAGWELIGKQ